MVTKKFRRVGSAGALALDPNAIIEVTVTGGLPVESDPEAPTRITKHRTAEGRRVRVTGGLPDGFAGEQMTAAERQAHDDAQYNAVMGIKGPTLGTGA